MNRTFELTENTIALNSAGEIQLISKVIATYGTQEEADSIRREVLDAKVEYLDKMIKIVDPQLIEYYIHLRSNTRINQLSIPINNRYGRIYTIVESD